MAPLELKILIYLAAILAAAGAITGAYFYAKHEGRMEERAIWELKQTEALKMDFDDLKDAIGTANSIAKGTQDELAKRKSGSVLDRGVIQREIQTNVVYASDCFAPNGLRGWNSISAGRAVLPDSGTGQQLDAGVSNGPSPANTGQQGGNPAPKLPPSPPNVRRVPPK